MMRRFVGLVCLWCCLVRRHLQARRVSTTPTTPTTPTTAATLVSVAITGAPRCSLGKAVSFRRQRRSATGPPVT